MCTVESLQRKCVMHLRLVCPFTDISTLSVVSRPNGTLFSKKYGVDLIRYAHGDTETVVYSSNKLDGNDTVRTSIQVLEAKNKQQTIHGHSRT